MKKITPKDEQLVLQVLQMYNVGIKEYSKVVQMFETLPKIEEPKETNENNKEDKKGNS